MGDEIRFILRKKTFNYLYYGDCSRRGQQVGWIYVKEIRVENAAFQYTTTSNKKEAQEIDWDTLKAIIFADKDKLFKVIKVVKRYEEIEE